MKTKLRSVLLLTSCAALTAMSVEATATNAIIGQSARQDGAQLKQTVQGFLEAQAVGLPGDVSIAVSDPDARLNVPACAAPEAFMPPHGRLWGRTAVGVRCTAPAIWTIYMTATVQIMDDYLTPAHPLSSGQIIAAQDLVTLRGDLTALPTGTLTDPADAIGRTVTRALQLGMPIRAAFLRSPRAVQQGQSVKVIARGASFSIATEARALSNGDVGQTVRARTPSGQVVSGLAQAGGIVEVVF